MKRVLFVCHGNICRSPIAACLLRHMARAKGLEKALYIDSAATSAEELGNPIYPPARRILEAHGVAADGHRATRLTPADYGRYDYLLGMDSRNIENMRRILGGDPQHKVRRLLDRDIADPWYTGDFETAFRDISQGCAALLREMGLDGAAKEA